MTVLQWPGSMAAPEIQTFMAGKSADDPSCHRNRALLCITGGFQAFDPMFYVLTNGDSSTQPRYLTHLSGVQWCSNQDIGHGPRWR